MQSSLSLTGIGLRIPHLEAILEQQPKFAWLEVVSENYFADGGKNLNLLKKIRDHYPISLHGTSLSLGSADELNWDYLKKLKNLCHEIHPCLISDHLGWSSINGRYLHNLLPLPYTEETLEYIILRINQVQDYLNRQILIENIPNYIRYPHSTLPEQDFLKEVAQQSGCGILLSINHIGVSAKNFNFDAQSYISAIPPALVQELHMGGITTSIINNEELFIATQDNAIAPFLWDLYQQAIQHLGSKPTIIEWDNHLPPLETLYLEAHRAETIMREIHAATKLTG